MNLKIEPCHLNFCTCFEDIIVTVARWKGIPYEPMFYKSWSFQYYPDKSKETLGEKISIWRTLDEETENIICSYMGVYYERINVQKNEIYTTIVNNLAEKLPVGISMDAYYIPWNPHYGKSHLVSDFLIIGYESDRYICIDPFVNGNTNSLKMTEMPDDQLGLILFQFHERNLDINIKKILKKSVECTLFGLKAYHNDFEQMRQLARDINYEQMRRELKEISNIEYAPTIRALKLIEMSRTAFIDFLETCQLSDVEYENMREYFLHIVLLWSNVKCMLIKFAVKGYSPSLLDRIKVKIIEVSEFEEMIAKRILAILK